MEHIHNHYFLEKLPPDQLLDLAKFVVGENFNYHTNKTNLIDYKQEIDSIFKEEFSYSDGAQVFVYRDLSNSIVGSIRVLKWNYINILPIQKIFNIDVSELYDDNCLNPIWHIGRFAIRKNVRNINLFKQLMVCAIAPICHNKDAVAYAECDSKLFRTLHTLGINAQPLGEAIHYLGSKTIPIKMSYKGLINFYTKNRILVSDDFLVHSKN